MKRHPQHDYAQPGAYFITFVTAGREPLLGRILDSRFEPTVAGRIVQAKWHLLPKLYKHVELDAFQIMPDHVHCILILVALEEDGKLVYSPTGISKIINTFKSTCTREIRRLPGMVDRQIWQRGYNDRVIRSDKELEKYRFYIETNVQRIALK